MESDFCQLQKARSVCVRRFSLDLLHLSCSDSSTLNQLNIEVQDGTSLHEDDPWDDDRSQVLHFHRTHLLLTEAGKNVSILLLSAHQGARRLHLCSYRVEPGHRKEEVEINPSFQDCHFHRPQYTLLFVEVRRSCCQSWEHGLLFLNNVSREPRWKRESRALQKRKPLPCTVEKRDQDLLSHRNLFQCAECPRPILWWTKAHWARPSTEASESVYWVWGGRTRREDTCLWNNTHSGSCIWRL